MSTCMAACREEAEGWNGSNGKALHEKMSGTSQFLMQSLRLIGNQLPAHLQETPLACF